MVSYEQNKHINFRKKKKRQKHKLVLLLATRKINIVEMLCLLSLMFLHSQEHERQARKQLSCGQCSLFRAFVPLLLSLVHISCQHKEAEVCFLVLEEVG